VDSFGSEPTDRVTPHGRAIDRSRRRRRTPWWVALWAVALIVVFAGAFVGVAVVTDRPAFCGSCHEMAPYQVAWAAGKHADVSCIECHVDSGLPARLKHKFVALGEVRSHFTGDTSFPRPTPPDVPSVRCLRCHPNLPEKTKSGFPHGQHVRKGTCAGCHPQTGHDVTPAALQAAGIYQAGAVPTIPAGAIAAVGAGSANVAGHIAVSCSGCHDLAKTGCKRCHTSKHKPRGDCLLCHRAGATFAFVHPSRGVDCAPCHKRPSGHTDDADCLACHDKPGKTWMYTHQPGQDCGTCHARPAKHRAGACPDCHKNAGTNWAFAHPGAGSNCRTCHEPPSGHFAGTCTNCHPRVGVSFAFSHPSAGEHSWRSRPCAKCHPSGTASVSCTCHGGRTPGN
jgi:hypothetical protein